MSGENSYLSRFFVKFVEVGAAGLATAISAYALAHFSLPTMRRLRNSRRCGPTLPTPIAACEPVQCGAPRPQQSYDPVRLPSKPPPESDVEAATSLFVHKGRNRQKFPVNFPGGLGASALPFFEANLPGS